MPTPSNLTATPPDARSAASGLRHVLIVGGTLRQWAEQPESMWEERIVTFGETARGAGARWLTLRPYEAGDGLAEISRREAPVGHGPTTCTVIIDPTVDGRHRFADAMGGLDPLAVVDEATVAAALYAPAEAEPDLVLVLGPDSRLPASLVWELGYAELVFAATPWPELAAADLARAIDEYTSRSRRFGGLP
ncbi:MAG: undecaprenyl diphosphate synthase family protein [Actinomycetota bacterium]|nr:undecaprenyl diphosphate synthase family protein [Actinomycetota bacterium]